MPINLGYTLNPDISILYMHRAEHLHGILKHPLSRFQFYWLYQAFHSKYSKFHIIIYSWRIFPNFFFFFGLCDENSSNLCGVEFQYLFRLFSFFFKFGNYYIYILHIYIYYDVYINVLQCIYIYLYIYIHLFIQKLFFIV